MNEVQRRINALGEYDAKLHDVQQSLSDVLRGLGRLGGEPEHLLFAFMRECLEQSYWQIFAVREVLAEPLSQKRDYRKELTRAHS